MLTLTATAVGFHTTSPLGLPMAPAAFLRSPTNIEGTILFEPATGRWITAESLRHPSHTIEITASQPEGTGFRTDITISEITWLRTDATGTHVIGTLALDLTLTAEHQESRPGTTWELDLADALEDIVQAEGFRFLGAAGDDILIPSAPILPIYGRVEMHGRGGDDHLTGSLADDFLFGGTGDDVLTDISGTNRLRGGAGDDRLELGLWSDGSIAWGGLGHDILTSSNGSDRLLGGRGHDRIEAGRGADILLGNAGNDALSGGDGADRLTGGRGNDRLTGGDDADIFVFSASHRGWDRITDFNAAEDTLHFHGLAGGYEELSFHTREGGTFLHWGARGAGLFLEGVDAAALTEDVFLF